MPLDQPFVPSVSELSLLLRGSDYIREQDRGQHGVKFGRGRRDADELSDRIEHGGLFVEPQHVLAGEELGLRPAEERRVVLQGRPVALAGQEKHGRSDPGIAPRTSVSQTIRTISTATSGVAVCRLSIPHGTCSAFEPEACMSPNSYASVPQRSRVA